jgi:hypothetical protein
MRAVRIVKYGGRDDLILAEIPDVRPPAGERSWRYGQLGGHRDRAGAAPGCAASRP